MDEVMSMGNELIGKVGDNSSIFLAGTYRPSMAALIVTIVVGLLICLFGLKLMRLRSWGSCWEQRRELPRL